MSVIYKFQPLARWKVLFFSFALSIFIFAIFLLLCNLIITTTSYDYQQYVYNSLPFDYPFITFACALLCYYFQKHLTSIAFCIHTIIFGTATSVFLGVFIYWIQHQTTESVFLYVIPMLICTSISAYLMMRSFKSILSQSSIGFPDKRTHRIG